MKTTLTELKTIIKNVILEELENDDDIFDIPLPILKVDNINIVPKNFTGIAKNRYGSKAWYKDGKLNREDGPAAEWASGRKEYRLNNKLNREDGPAVIESDGKKEYWLNNKEYSKEEYEEIMRKKSKRI